MVVTGPAEVHKSYAQAVQYSPERTKHGLGMEGVPDAPRKQSKAVRKSKAGSTPKFKRVKPWNMHGCILNKVATDFAVLLHVKYFVAETYNLRRLYKTSQATWGSIVSPWVRSQGFQESPTDRFPVCHSENDVAMSLWGGHIMARGSQDDVIWIFNRLQRQFHCEDGGCIHGDKFQVKSDGNYTRQSGGTPRDATAKVLKYRKQLNRSCDASELEQAAVLQNCCQLDPYKSDVPARGVV